MTGKGYPGKGKVAIVKTSPETILEDYARVIELAGFREALPLENDTFLKINISWQTWYPACSTAPGRRVRSSPPGRYASDPSTGGEEVGIQEAGIDGAPVLREGEFEMVQRRTGRR